MRSSRSNLHHKQLLAVQALGFHSSTIEVELTTRHPSIAGCVVTEASVSNGDILYPFDKTIKSSLLPLKAQRFCLLGCLRYKSLKLTESFSGNVLKIPWNKSLYSFRCTQCSKVSGSSSLNSKPEWGWKANQNQSSLGTTRFPMNKPSVVPVKFKTLMTSFTFPALVGLTGPSDLIRGALAVG